MESQRAVGRHAEEGEELTGACEGQPETQGGTASEVEGRASGGTRLKPVSIYNHRPKQSTTLNSSFLS